jgi:hypothetical protein
METYLRFHGHLERNTVSRAYLSQRKIFRAEVVEKYETLFLSPVHLCVGLIVFEALNKSYFMLLFYNWRTTEPILPSLVSIVCPTLFIRELRKLALTN